MRKKTNKIKLKRASKSMRGEKALDLIGKYLILTIIIILLGLLSSNEEGKGIPLAWYTDSGIDAYNFLISFLIIGAIVRVADIIARFSSLREKVYRTPYKASDSVVVNSSSGIVINGFDDYEGSDSYPSEAPVISKLPEKNKPKLDLTKYRKLRPQIGQKNTSSFFSIIALVVVIVISAVTFIISSVNRPVDYIPEPDYIDSEYYDNYYDEENSPLFELVADALENHIFMEDEDFLKEIGQENISEFYDYLDWKSLGATSYYTISESVNDEETEAVLKLSIWDDYSQSYVLAVKLVGDDIRYGDSEITGISICKDIFDSEIYSHDFDPSNYSDEEWNMILSILAKDSVTVGDGVIDGESILTWEHNWYDSI